MNPERDSLDRRLDELAARLAAVESRLARIESRAGDPLDPAVASEPESPRQTGGSPAQRPERLALVGRTLLVIAGAFLLRAVTESGVVPLAAGSVVGLAYAAIGLWLAERAATRGRPTSALFHALASALIAFPLIVEATVKFGFLAADRAAVAVALFAAAALVVAGRHRLEGVAWIFALGSVASSLVLVAITHAVAPFSFSLLVLGLASFWIGNLRGIGRPAWLVAAGFDALAVLILIVSVKAPDAAARLVSPEVRIGILGAAALGYLGGAGFRVLKTGGAGRFEATQAVVTTSLALAGAAVGARGEAAIDTLVGAFVVAVAVIGYGVALAGDARAGKATPLGLAFSAVGLAACIVAVLRFAPRPAATILFAVAAVTAAWLGRAREMPSLVLHAPVYLLGAAAVSGLLTGAIRAFAARAPVTPAWPQFSPMLALGAVAVALGVLVRGEDGRTAGHSRLSRRLVSAILLTGLGGVAVSLLGRLPAAWWNAGTPVSVLATVKTGVLAVSAVGLAGLAGRPRLRDASCWVYPILAIGGIKLLWDDARSDQTVALVVSLAVYGSALIVAPRLARRRGGGTDGPRE